MRLKNKFGQSRPEQCLDVDDGLCISHIVLLSNHGTLLVNHHHGVGKSDPTSQQTVQTVEREGTTIKKLKIRIKKERNKQIWVVLLVDRAHCIEHHGEPADCLQEVCFGSKPIKTQIDLRVPPVEIYTHNDKELTFPQ